MLDLRQPSGFFFAITGIFLVVAGITDPTRPPMTDANVNLYAGAVMTAFGLILLLLAWRSRKV
jgi:uncharacterized membrane protein HdeD (DUF308 family)